MIGGADSELTVLRLALRGRGDAVTRRLRSERLIAAADLRPAGLPVGAVLVVRALRAKAPSDSPLPPAGWSAELRARLDQLYRAAAHPVRGPVPPAAASVVFADAGELLACLTRDVLAGRAWGCWYWRRALGELPPAPGPALAAAWCAYATALPPALGQLAPAEARAALLCLAPAEIGAVVHALHAAYALPPTVFAPPSRAHAQQVPGAAAPPDRPWRAWLAPQAAAGLTPQAEYLWGMALALWRAPALAHGAPFAERAAMWLYAELERLEASGTPPAPGAPEPRAGPAAIAGAAPATHAGQNEHVVNHPEAARPHGPLGPAGRDSMPVAPDETRAPPVVPEPVPQPLAPAPQTQEPAAGQGLATGLGGALYLINLLARLGWPAWHPADGEWALGGWGLLEALAGALLGDAVARYADDPLWAALAALGGRPPDLPIAALLAPQAAEWLAKTVDKSRAMLARLLDDAPAAIERLICVRGRLALSRTHVDLHMALDSISIAARRAGLDRDPGWVPQLGRIVLFHFV